MGRRLAGRHAVAATTGTHATASAAVAAVTAGLHAAASAAAVTASMHGAAGRRGDGGHQARLRRRLRAGTRRARQCPSEILLIDGYLNVDCCLRFVPSFIPSVAIKLLPWIMDCTSGMLKGLGMIVRVSNLVAMRRC